jgi:hypothetical protein
MSGLGIELLCGNHRSEAIKVGVYVRSNDIHEVSGELRVSACKRLIGQPVAFFSRELKIISRTAFCPASNLFSTARQVPIGKVIMEIIGVMTGKQDDPVFVDALFRCILQKFGSVQMRHFQVNDHEVEIFPHRLQSLQRIFAGLYIQTRIVMLNIGTQEEKKGFIIVNYEYLAHSLLILSSEPSIVTRRQQ